jgi:S1-C subfamily serine protease
LRAAVRRHERAAVFLGALLAGALVATLFWSSQPAPREYTQEDIDAAVMHTVETKALPSQAARAAEAVRQSVVRVNGYTDERADEDDEDADKEGMGRKGFLHPWEKKEGKDGKSEPEGKGGKEAPSAREGKGGKTERDAKSRSQDRRAATGERGKEGAKQRAQDGRNESGKDAGTKGAKAGAGDRGAAKGGGKSPAGDGKDAKPGDETPPKMVERRTRVGTGVVIVDNGTILTNLHVVAGAKRITVTFHDGSESEVQFMGAQPENDLAVIRARTIPDDLPSATLGSSGNLRPGDEVTAVGFPFGIGPSVSSGVVSGLNREFGSPEGKRKLRHLIQFDAAVNPGNSGGPLVNSSGEVVGIVTALLNPSEQRTFIGIGFAATIESAGSAVGIPPF